MKTIAPQLPLPGAQVPPQAPAFVLEPETAARSPAQDRATLELFAPRDLQRPPAQDLAAWIARQPGPARARLIARGIVQYPTGRLKADI